METHNYFKFKDELDKAEQQFCFLRLRLTPAPLRLPVLLPVATALTGVWGSWGLQFPEDSLLISASSSPLLLPHFHLLRELNLSARYADAG